MGQKPLGILGGGQLARMIALEAHRLGIPTAVMSPFKGEPAAQVSNRWREGDPNSASDLKAFFKECSAVTFESEFFDAEAIAEASRATGTPVWPKPDLMAKLQDRLTQKQLLDENDLATATWRPVDSIEDAVVAFAALGEKVVFKKRRFGYDGYGTFVVKSQDELAAFVSSQFVKTKADVASGKLPKPSFIAECFIPFKRELALIAVRDQKGAVVFYPFVESKQKDSRCLWVQGPLKATAKEAKALRDLRQGVGRFLQATGYVGAIGIEFFETRAGYLINELAPRVHNTGHYTLDAYSESQFALHARATFGLRCAQPEALSGGFAMWNLLGSEKPAAKPTPELAASIKNVRMHWYGKEESRPGRKMAHLNTVAKTPTEALKLAKQTAGKWMKQIGI